MQSFDIPSGDTRRPRVCAACGRDMLKRLRVFLVRQSDGAILGPFHGECARALSDHYRREISPADMPHAALPELGPSGQNGNTRC
jgi:hypothetical protein